MNQNRTLHLIGGVRLKDYPKQPDDYSPSTIENCAECGEPFWFSHKKKIIMHSLNPENVMLACMDCLRNHLKETEYDGHTIQKLDI